MRSAPAGKTLFFLEENGRLFKNPLNSLNLLLLKHSNFLSFLILHRGSRCAGATLEDVAKKAQVSTATASRVLNRIDSHIAVTDKTKRRIFNAVRELNYRPNVLARSFRTQKSNTLGVVMTYLVDPYCATIIHGIDQAANAKGYRLVLLAIHDKPEPLNTCREMFGQKNVDGVIVVGFSLKLDDESVVQLEKEGMKIALIGREIKNSSLPSVLVDEAKGGFLATEHLIKLGHKRIGFISIPGSVSRGVSRSVCHMRLEGALAALRTYRLDFDERWSVSAEGATPFTWSQTGYEGMREILGRGKRPTAIFAFGDVLAFGAIVAIRERGLRVPEDIAVVGFDDMVNVAAYYNPPLTTVRQPMVEMGKRGADLLVNLLQAKRRSTPPERIVMEPELVVRKSSAGNEYSDHYQSQSSPGGGEASKRS